MFLYYITDRKQLSPHADEGKRLLPDRIRMCAEAGIDAIQIRERDLNSRELLELGRKAAAILAEKNSGIRTTRLLINSRIDVAIACKADGVHLRSNDISAADARAVFQAAGVARPLIGVSCHSLHEVELAEGHGADFAVFAPVFEKIENNRGVAGVESLRQVCRGGQLKPGMPVLALGGVTLSNAQDCLEAGAAGIAGIRLFQSGNVSETIASLRALEKRAVLP